MTNVITKLDYLESYEEGTDLFKSINKPKSFRDEYWPNKSYYDVVYEALKFEYWVYNYLLVKGYEVKWNDKLYTDKVFHEDVYHKPDLYVKDIGVEVKLIKNEGTKCLNLAINKAKLEEADVLIYKNRETNKIKWVDLSTLDIKEIP